MLTRPKIVFVFLHGELDVTSGLVPVGNCFSAIFLIFLAISFSIFRSAVLFSLKSIVIVTSPLRNGKLSVGSDARELTVAMPE
jgi:hypothetical protein